VEKQDVYLIIGSFAIGIAIVYAGYIASYSSPITDLTNSQALVVEAAFALILAVIFYLLSRKNEKLIERRDNKRKQFWLDLASRNINSIRAWHVRLLGRYENSFVDNVIGDDSILKTDVGMASKQITERHRPRIANAITQIADLLDDPSLFNQLTLYEFNTFIKPDRYNKNNQHYKDQIKGLAGSIDYIDKILDRIKAESPNGKLDSREAL
jgi:hypothetical protein